MKYFHYLLRAIVIGLLVSYLAYYLGYQETIDNMLQAVQGTSVFQTVNDWHRPLEAKNPIFELGPTITLVLFISACSACIPIYINLNIWWRWMVLNRKYRGRMNKEQWELFFARLAVKEAYFKEGSYYPWASNRNRGTRNRVDPVILVLTLLVTVLPFKLFPAEFINTRLVLTGLTSVVMAVFLVHFYYAWRFAELSSLPHGFVDRYLEEDRHLDVSESPAELLGL